MIFLLAAGSFLCLGGPEVMAAERIGAVQILVLEGKSVEDLRPLLQSWREAGLDTVILRAFHLPGDRPHLPAAGSAPAHSQGVYFPTTLAPVIADLFTPFVALCREEGIRPFAWMVTRQALFGEQGLPRDEALDPATGTTRQGDFLDIFHEAGLAYLEGLFSDLASTGVDGILLQDDLALRMTEGFSPSALDLYRWETGDSSPPAGRIRVALEDGKRVLRPGPGFDRWTGWKTMHLAALGRRLEMAAQKARPGTVLIMNLMYEALTDPENGRLWLSQDLDTALRSGPSRTAVMLYHRQMEEELGLPLQDVLLKVRKALESKGTGVDQPGIILKFQTRDWKTSAPVPEIDLLAALTAAWEGNWSVAFVPPPTDRQLQAMELILEGWGERQKRE